MTEIEVLRAEIASLREEVRLLRAQGWQQVIYTDTSIAAGGAAGGYMARAVLNAPWSAGQNNIGMIPSSVCAGGFAGQVYTVMCS